MNRKVLELLDGVIEYEQPRLLLSQERVEATISAGETLTGELVLQAEDGSPIRGFVTTSSRRIVPGLSHFEGTLIRLPFGIDCAGLPAGYSFSGWLSFSTSAGEYRLPFSVKTSGVEVRDTAGEVLSLDEFVTCAREDFRDAFTIFSSPDFPLMIEKTSPRAKALYKGFIHQPVTNQNLEEFLISLGRKKPVWLSCEEKGKELFGIERAESEEFVITKSGWGHLRLDVVAQGDFLTPAKKVLTEEDFIGSKCSVRYLVNPQKLSGGIHYGSIQVISPYQTMTYQVAASTQKDAKGMAQKECLEKKHLLCFYKDLLSFLLAKLPYDEWKASARYSVNALLDAGEGGGWYKLFEVWLLLAQEKVEEAKEILGEYKGRTYTSQERELAGAFLFLSLEAGMINDRQEVASRIRALYNQQGDSFLLLYFLLELDSELASSPKKSLFRLEELFERGCRSPFLYLEAWRRLVRGPGNLHRLSRFWGSVFYFAARRGLYNAELAMRFTYLTGYEKEFSPLILAVLEKIYEAQPSDDTLEALCKYIIRGNPHHPRFFKWFALAVERGLRLTRLFEYYVEAMDVREAAVLPRPLLMYFKYNSDTLGDAKRAYIYSSVLARRREDPKTYALYEEHMRTFAWEKLMQGRLGDHYASLYTAYCEKPTNEKEAYALARMMATCRVSVEDFRARQVVVVAEELSREEIYPVNRGVCYPRLYTPHAVLLFQDEKQRRYEATVKYEMRALYPKPWPVREILDMGCEDAGVLLAYVSEREISPETLPEYEKAAESEAFSLDYRRSLRRRLLDYFSENITGEELSGYLSRLDTQEYVKVDKAKFLKVLIEAGLTDRAMDVISMVGWEGLEKKSLLSLADHEAKKGEATPERLALCTHVFSLGLYTEEILTFLLANMKGPLSSLLELKKAAGAASLDTKEVEKKILELLIFTSDYRREGEEVLNDYIRHGGEEELIGAYLTQLSYGTFVHEYPMSPFLLACLYHLYKEEWKVPFICHLALLKELSKGNPTNIPAEEVMGSILEECAAKGMSFAFFRRLPSRELARFG